MNHQKIQIIKVTYLFRRNYSKKAQVALPNIIYSFMIFIIVFIEIEVQNVSLSLYFEV